MPIQIMQIMILTLQTLADQDHNLRMPYVILQQHNLDFYPAGVNEGFDYGKLENARKLNEGE